MTTLQFLTELDKIKLPGEADSIWKQLLSRGILPLKIIEQRELALQVEAFMSTGKSKRQSVERVADKMDVSDMKVWRALKACG